MPVKRSISHGGEEESLTRPSDAFSATLPNLYQHNQASYYDLGLTGSEADEIERQRLLPLGMDSQGGQSEPSKSIPRSCRG